MVTYNYELEFSLENEASMSLWITEVIGAENMTEGDISYIFCKDEYLFNINVKYLKHNTLTDIISFDYTESSLISGDIFISVERVRENADKFEVQFKEELCRVMIHGVLHFMGYKDKSEDDKILMRAKEDYYLSLRTF